MELSRIHSTSSTLSNCQVQQGFHEMVWACFYRRWCSLSCWTCEIAATAI